MSREAKEEPVANAGARQRSIAGRPMFHVDSEAEGFASYGPEQIRAAVGFENLIGPVAAALADFSKGVDDTSSWALATADRVIRVTPSWLPERDYFVVKVASRAVASPTTNATPDHGFVGVFCTRTGKLRAVLRDNHHLTDASNAAAGALSIRFMAGQGAATLGVLGSGVQAYLQALAACGERYIRAVRIWSSHTDESERLAAALAQRRPELRVERVASPREACTGSDVVVTTAAASEPIIEGGWLGRGVHLVAVGADSAGKSLLAPSVLEKADCIVVDSRAIALRSGDIAHAIAAGTIDESAITAELGEVVADRIACRLSDRDITICTMNGLGVLDLAAAHVALERLEHGCQAPLLPASDDDLLPTTM